MTQPFVTEPGTWGPRLVLAGDWSAAAAEFVRRAGVRELVLNDSRGWAGKDLRFLREIPDLVAFTILDFTIGDVSPVHELTRLRQLEISTYCRTPISFGSFPELEDCSFYWRAGSESLFDRAGLTQLWLHRYDGAASAPFARLRALEQLTIANSSTAEVESLGELRALRSLALHGLRALRSLRGLERLVDLEALEVNGCRGISAIDELAPLTKLRRLQLNDDGEIASLAPIAGAKMLEEVLFYESTKIADGDLTPLAALPRLATVSFRNRKRYTHRREQLARP